MVLSVGFVGFVGFVAVTVGLDDVVFGAIVGLLGNFFLNASRSTG